MSPHHLADAEEQADAALAWLDHFLNGVGVWIGEALNWAADNLLWVIIFFCFGGGSLLALLWEGLTHVLTAPARGRRRRVRAREETDARRRRAQLDRQHREEGCACGERCAGSRACEAHHPDCNCDHRDSYCVCKNTKKCSCECRCQCKDCEGYYLNGPLRRLPQPTGATAEPTGAPAEEPASASAGTRAKQEPRPKRLSWTNARIAFMALSEEYAGFECDRIAVVELPALTDVTFGPTAAFIEAFYEANQLLTDRKPEKDKDARRFVDAAERARVAWREANEAARVVGDSRLGEDEQALLRRIRTANRLAENAGEAGEADGAELKAATMMRELAARTKESGRWRLPEPVRLELEAVTRRLLLPAASATANAETGAETDAESNGDGVAAANGRAEDPAAR